MGRQPQTVQPAMLPAHSSTVSAHAVQGYILTPLSAFVNLATLFVMNVQGLILMSVPAVKITWSSALDLALVTPTALLTSIPSPAMPVIPAVDNVLSIILQHVSPVRIISFFRTENVAVHPHNTLIPQAIHVFPATRPARAAPAQPQMAVLLAFQD